MNFRKHIIFTLTFLLSIISIDSYEAYGAAKRNRTKAKTVQGAKRQSKSKKSSKKRRAKSAKKQRVKKAQTPPPELVANDSLTMLFNDLMVGMVPQESDPGGLRVNLAVASKFGKTLQLKLNENFTYLPLTKEMISTMESEAKRNLPDSLEGYQVRLTVGSRNLAYYINQIDPLPENSRHNVPFVVEAKPACHPSKGMEGDIVALWSSHGRYFKNGSWQWQRPLLFQSIEDTYTMGYITPYLAPMLENAGAYVMMPRERDWNSHEVIVDNDTNEGGMLFSQTTYVEKNESRKWRQGEFEGFIYDLPDFRDTENPFENGTYREVETIRNGKPSVAAWRADIPEDGEYAVYISYKTLPNSTEDAHYTVNYSGGSKEFRVNQRMGGGTWIYLGTFPFKKGHDPKIPQVTLTNLTEKGDPHTVVTADAVKIGGGMGNIARSPRRSDIYYEPSTPDASYSSDSDGKSADSTGGLNKGGILTAQEELNQPEDGESTDEDTVEEDEEEDDNDAEEETVAVSIKQAGPAPTFRTSGLPRYLEGARYWLHWAGAPENVYSPYHGADDYKDDYTSRGNWVNWLAGGSRVLPGREGLGIPVDLAFALHSDAGKRSDDSFVGTLGICFTNDGAAYKDGTPRVNSRMLTDLIMRQINLDVRKLHEPSWTRRSLWDKSYVEARVPEVPTTLIELMSHQNFADMQYGLDPEFRFTVARAIYKAMARFMAERKKRQLVIQPLPVKDFAVLPHKKGHYRLSWRPTADKLEPTAVPDKYLIFERNEGDLGFHKIGETAATHFDIKVTDDHIHSFKIVAVNAGGESFPSEILSMRDGGKDSGPILIVNGFTRLSAPGKFNESDRAGFDAENDFGVSYLKDASFTGYQTEFRRSAGESFGRSSGNYIGKVIAGNSFDYPMVHGEAIADAGYGFVSCSVAALESGIVNPSDFRIIDLILGKQKTSVTGRNRNGIKYQAISRELQPILDKYLNSGGKLFISGAYLASDLNSKGGESKRFLNEVLGIDMDSEATPSKSGRGIMTADAKGVGNLRIPYSNNLNEDIYIVERPDGLKPYDGRGKIMGIYSDTGSGAVVEVDGVGKGKTIVSSIPFETITDETVQLQLMQWILQRFRK